MKRRTNLGDYPVMGYVRFGKLTLPMPAFIDTGTKHSIVPREIADAAGAKKLGRAGKLNILKRSLHGELVKIRVSSFDGRCSGETTAFVPNAGEDWQRGVMLGAEFLQDTKMHVNAQGEAYCPTGRKKR